jgi:hypothetical protein
MSVVATNPSPTGVNRLGITQPIIHASDLHKPEYDPRYYTRYPDDGQMIKFLYDRALVKRIRNESITHFEQPRTVQSFKVVNQAGGSAGAAVTLTLHTDSHDANGYSFVRNNDVIMFAGGVRAQVSSKADTGGASGANTISVTPLISGESIPATTNGEVVIILTNLFPTGSTGPTSRSWEPIKVTSFTQIIREAYKIENSSRFSQTWVKDLTLGPDHPLVRNKLFTPGDYKFVNDSAHTYCMFRVAQEMALMMGVRATNNLVLNAQAGSDQNSMKGLIPSIQDDGLNPTPYTVGSFGLTEMEAITTLLIQQGGAKENMFMTGISLSQEMNSFLHTLYENGAVTYGAFGNSKDRAVTYGFDSFTLDSFTFHKQVYNLFSHPELLGAANFDYSGKGFVVPLDTQYDSQKGESIPSLRMLVRGDRDTIAEVRGGMTGHAGLNQSSEDAVYSDYLSEIGLQTVALNRFVWVDHA